MELNDYQHDAMRTHIEPKDAKDRERVFAIYVLGIAGEAGEVTELAKKHLGHGHELDADKMCKELGDVLWYIAATAHLLGIPLEEIAEKNIAKLKARYPEGFSHEASKNRVEGAR